MRRDKAPLPGRWPASLQGSLLKERHAVERFDLLPVDYPNRLPSSVDVPVNWRTKLGGWPAWQQGDDTPLCPHDRTPMRFVFQFLSHSASDTLISADFSHHLFVCERHADTWAFVHQCS